MYVNPRTQTRENIGKFCRDVNTLTPQRAQRHVLVKVTSSVDKESG